MGSLHQTRWSFVGLGLRCAAVVGALTAYALGILLLYPSQKQSTVALSMVPVALASWLFGLRGGFVVWLLTVPLNIGLVQAAGGPGWEQPFFRWPGELSRLIIVLGFGWARHLFDRVQAQARQLLEDREAIQKEVAQRRRAEADRSMFRTREKTARERLDLLAQSSLCLADSLDYQTTAASVASVAVPNFADWCILDVIEPDQPPHRHPVATADSTKRDLLERLRLYYPANSDSQQPAAQALRGGKTVLLQFPDEQALAATTQDAEHFRILQELGPRSTIAVPLAARGQTLGALTFVLAESGRTYHALDVDFAEDLGRRCALAIDNARLYRAARDEIAERKQAEAALARAGRELEDRVVARTAELEQANERLATEIAGRVQSEERLRTSEERLRLALEAALMGTWSYDIRQERTQIDDNLLLLHGVTRADFDGSTAASMALMHPDDRDKVGGVMDQVVRARQALAVEYRSIRPDGSLRWFQSQGRAVADENDVVVGILGLTQDVTLRKQMERAVRAGEERYRRIVETATEGICVFGPDERLTLVNGRLAALLNSSVDELLHRPFLEFVEPEHRPAATEQLAVVRAGGTVQHDVRLLPCGGGDLWVFVSAAPLLDEAGQFAGVLVMVADVTERRRLEGQLRQAQKMEAVGRLAGGVAHDFNNLLTVITGYGDLLRDDLGPTHPSASLVVEVQKAAERAAQLTNQLLAFSRKQLIAPCVLDLNAILADTLPMLRRLIGEDVLLRTVPAAAPLLVRIDHGQLQSVFVNLAVNARDAMPRGGTLHITTAAQDPPEDGGRPTVCLTVADTGVGMTAEVKAHLFEPFFTTKGLGQGTGMGLSTIYGIVQQAGGRIEVESEPDHGATFRITFPQAEMPAAEAAVAPSIADAPASGARVTVLVVEDEEIVRALVLRVLTQHGYTVLPAAGGADALRIAEDFVGRIHILLADVVMPGASGREVAESLVATRPDLKVLYMSGYTDDAVLRHGVRDAGAPFLQKPFSPEALVRKIREVLGSADPVAAT